MFDAVVGVKFGYVLCGIIWAIALGFAVGNYACSLVHRLPRGRLILDKKPYCGNCGTMLQVKDLFPVVSALMLRHRCRYCREPFPVSHTWTELLVGLLFVLAFLQHNFSEEFLLIILVGTFLITLAAIEANEGVIVRKIVLCIAVFGALLRVLYDNTIYDAFDGALFSGIISAVLWRKDIKKVGHIYSVPDPALLLTVGGMCVGGKNLILYFIFFAVAYALDWSIRKLAGSPRPVLITVPFGIATILPVLYPKLALLFSVDILFG